MIENLTDMQVRLPIVHNDTGEVRTLTLNPRGCIKRIPPDFSIESKFLIRNPKTLRISSSKPASTVVNLTKPDAVESTEE